MLVSELPRNKKGQSFSFLFLFYFGDCVCCYRAHSNMGAQIPLHTVATPVAMSVFSFHQLLNTREVQQSVWRAFFVLLWVVNVWF